MRERPVVGGAAAVARGPILLLGAYLSALTFGAWVGRARARRRAAARSAPSSRFCVLIPAHDEEQLIGATVDSLLTQAYPADLFEVHVVADNCTDRTAEIVRARGVEVHERRAPDAPGKGPALEWLLARLEEQGRLDATLVFLDADTVADRDFLRELDRAMTPDSRAVQADYAVRVDGASASVAFRAAAFAARNHLRPLGRTALGGTAGLNGNGMAFDAATMRGRTWSDHLTEDAKLSLELLLDGVKVEFAPLARVEAEMPDSLSTSQSQHDRWEQGRIDLARQFVPALARDAVRGGPAGRIAAIEATLDTMMPPLSIVVVGTAGWNVAALVRHLVHPTASSRRDLALGALVMASEAAYVLSALVMVGAPASSYRALLGAPKMVGWKVVQWVRILVRPRRDGWVRTARNEPG